MRDEKCIFEKKLYIESEETSIVNLKVITQPWYCNSCPDYKERKEGEVQK
jgi:hypothetical protein